MVFRVLYAYCQSYSDLHVRRYSDRGGGGVRVVGWYFAYCMRTVRVTLTYMYADTLTRGGGW